MINKNNIIILCLCFFSLVKGQLEVSPIITQEDINQLMPFENLIVNDFFGCGVEVFNVSYEGHTESIGTFNYIQNDNICAGDFGLDRGLLMTTGMIEYATGPNNDGDDGEEWNVEYYDEFIHNYLVDFEVISPSVGLFDACVLEFDVTSSVLQSIDFEVIFGSEEYTEWMSPFYADAFCFFVSEINGDVDPNFNSVPRNIMETGDVLNTDNCNEIENKPISAWTIRPYSPVFNMPGLNECLYLDNANGEFCDAIGYDGYTQPMLFNFTLLPGASYRIKMIILDGVSNYWAGLDSGVFIKANPVENNMGLDFTWNSLGDNNLGTSISFNNISSSNLNGTYFWDFDSDGNMDSEEMNPIYTFEEPGDYIVSLQLINNCTGVINSISYEITIPGIGLSDYYNDNISIYPNPNVGKYLYVSSDLNYTSSYFLDIIDFSGRILQTLPLCSDPIDVSFLNKGIYSINIRNDGQSVYFDKLIVL